MLNLRRRTASAKRRGATLFELLVALLIFDLSLLSLAAVSALAVRRVGDAGRRSRSSVASRNRVETMLSRPCQLGEAARMSLERGVIESWASSAVGTGVELTDSIRIESRTPESVVLRVRRLC
jgi:Tfp pilus assembly protein PilV